MKVLALPTCVLNYLHQCASETFSGNNCLCLGECLAIKIYQVKSILLGLYFLLIPVDSKLVLPFGIPTLQTLLRKQRL